MDVPCHQCDRDDARRLWLAGRGLERHDQHEGHLLHASHVEGHKRPPASLESDQPDTADTGESTQRHVGPFSTDDGGCGTCAECDYDANHEGPCDCGHDRA